MWRSVRLMSDAIGAADVRALARDLLAAHDPGATEPQEFLRARFDAGLAWVHFPVGLGGLGAPRGLQGVVDAELAAARRPPQRPPPDRHRARHGRADHPRVRHPRAAAAVAAAAL